jgi:hypothetical protein
MFFFVGNLIIRGFYLKGVIRTKFFNFLNLFNSLNNVEN